MLLRTLAFATLALLSAALTASPGLAVSVKFVAANGTATTVCSATAPCGNLRDALVDASSGDNIICLSSVATAVLTIDKSITIDCATANGLFNGTTNGPDGSSLRIIINIPASDQLQTVRLRGLIIDGSGSAFANGRIADRGIEIVAAAAVHIEDCVISNLNKQGIYDHRTGGHTGLFVKDTFISGILGAGIVAASAAVSGTVLDNVTLENNGFGIAVARGNNVAIRNSVISGNSNAGIEGDSGSQITIYNSKISHNNIGVQSQSSVRVSNNDIEFNSAAF